MSKRVDIEGAQQLLRRRAQLVDVLPSAVYLKVHLPDAVNVPLETLDETSVQHLEREQAVLVYCFDQH